MKRRLALLFLLVGILLILAGIIYVGTMRQ